MDLMLSIYINAHKKFKSIKIMRTILKTINGSAYTYVLKIYAL